MKFWRYAHVETDTHVRALIWWDNNNKQPQALYTNGACATSHQPDSDDVMLAGIGLQVKRLNYYPNTLKKYARSVMKATARRNLLVPCRHKRTGPTGNVSEILKTRLKIVLDDYNKLTQH